MVTTTYERYCRERKAWMDTERAVGRSRATADLVEELLELTSSEEDKGTNTSTINPTYRHVLSGTKSRPASSGWSLSSSSIVSAALSVSSDDDESKQKSIQSYTGQLFSPLYVVKKDEHNIFQENRRPLPKPGQTPKYANLCYQIPDEGNNELDDLVHEAAPIGPSIHKPTMAPWKNILFPVSRSKQLGIKTAKSTSSLKKSSALLFVKGTKCLTPDLRTTTHAARSKSLLSQTPLAKHDVYMRKDWTLKSFASADSGQLSLEPLTNSFDRDSPPSHADSNNANEELVVSSKVRESRDESLSDILDATSVEEHDDRRFICFDEETRTPSIRGKSCGLQEDKDFDLPINNAFDCKDNMQSTLPPSESQDICNGGEVVHGCALPPSLQQVTQTQGVYSAGETALDSNIHIMASLPPSLFHDMLYRTFAALRQVTMDTMLSSEYSLCPMFTKAKHPLNTFRYEILLDNKNAIRFEVYKIGKEPAVTPMMPGLLDNCVSMDSDPCLRPGKESEQAGPNEALLLDSIPELNEEAEIEIDRMEDSIRLEVAEPEHSTSIDTDSICYAFSEPATVMHTIISIIEGQDFVIGNASKTIISVDFSASNLATGARKVVSRLSPTFSYDSHLASLGSYDENIYVDGNYGLFDYGGKFQYKSNSASSELKRYTADELFSNQEIVCFPPIVPSLMSNESERQSDDSCSILNDSHLRAVMEATRHGDHASNIFPAVSSDSFYMASSESDDGMDSELDALEALGQDLRQEIEAAESSISFLWTSPRKTAPREKTTLDSKIANNMCAIHGVSSSYSGEANATAVRRVHFNEEVQEFLFSNDVREELCRARDKDDSLLDDVIGVFEDLLDELSLACVSISRAMDRTTRTNQTARRSSAW